MQIVSIAHEHVVGLFVDLDIQVAGRTTTRSDFTLRGQTNPHPVTDTGGDLHADVTPRTHPAVATAAVTGVRDHLTDAGTGRAGSRGHHLAEQRTLHALHLASATADVTGDRRRIGVRSPALTHIA